MTADILVQSCRDRPNWIEGHATSEEHAMALLCRRCCITPVYIKRNDNGSRSGHMPGKKKPQHMHKVKLGGGG